MCFSWGCQLPPIYSPPPTQARKRNARTPAGPNTLHPHNKQCWREPLPTDWQSCWVRGRPPSQIPKVRWGGPQPPLAAPSSSPLPLKAMGRQTWERKPEVVRTRARDKKQTLNDTQHGRWEFKKKRTLRFTCKTQTKTTRTGRGYGEEWLERKFCKQLLTMEWALPCPQELGSANRPRPGTPFKCSPVGELVRPTGVPAAARPGAPPQKHIPTFHTHAHIQPAPAPPPPPHPAFHGSQGPKGTL